MNLRIRKKTGDFLLQNWDPRRNDYCIDNIEGEDYNLDNNLYLFRELNNISYHYNVIFLNTFKLMKVDFYYLFI